jgi:hypothetical protein
MDDKRFYRKLKQEVKRTGNRKRRRFLKDLSADPGDFEFGSAESSAFNGRDGKRKRVRHGRPENQEKTPKDSVEYLADSDKASKTNEQEGV